MTPMKRLVCAAIAVSLLGATAASAQSYSHGGYNRGYGHSRDRYDDRAYQGNYAPNGYQYGYQNGGYQDDYRGSYQNDYRGN